MQLNASTRELLGKRTRRLHRQGKLAAVVYGHNTKPTALVLDRLEFQKVFLKSGRTHLVDLLVDSGRTEKVLVREIQTHPRRRGHTSADTCPARGVPADRHPRGFRSRPDSIGGDRVGGPCV